MSRIYESPFKTKLIFFIKCFLILKAKPLYGLIYLFYLMLDQNHRVMF